MTIVFRYLMRQLLASMLAVSGILLLVFMSGRFIKYLSGAAEGKLAGDVLFAIMGYRLPGFLELILPLGLFLAILLAYGRMYLESEMTVLHACGMSEQKLLAYTLGISLPVGLLVALLSLWLSPWGMQEVNRILEAQQARSSIELLAPGRFQSFGAPGRVVYAQGMSADKRQLDHVFIADLEQAATAGRLSLVTALTGNSFIDPDTGVRFLQLNDGTRFDGRPGEMDYRVTQFAHYGLKSAEQTGRTKNKEDAVSTSSLLHTADPRAQALLQWRIALPLTVPVVALLALRLSRVNPRQGRFFHLLPAMLTYLAYLGALIAVRDALGKGKLPPWAGLWWVHLVFLGVALVLIYGPGLLQRKSSHAQA